MHTAKMPPISELRARVQKSEAEHGRIPWISRRVIHPHVSIYVTWILLRIGLSGNQATFLMMLCAVCGASLFFAGGTTAYLTGASLMLFSWVLDHSDGEVLRFRGESSALGIYLDRFTHRVSYPLVHLGLGASLYRQTGGVYWLLIGGVAAYFYQTGVANSLDKESIASQREGVERYPLRALRLRIASHLPMLDWPLKAVLGGFAELFQNKTLMVLVSAAAILGVVPHFYLLYVFLMIFNWLLITFLDLVLCFPKPGARHETGRPRTNGS